LLNTDVLVHLIRRDATGERIREVYEPLLIQPLPRVSAVSGGEIRSLAYQWGWGASKRAQMDFLLGYFDRVPITREIEEAYAVLDSYSLGLGVRMGKNDLWIAATAHVDHAHLLTEERDFDHLHPDFVLVEFVGGTPEAEQ
jgi:tRNA(fMet)-specific endonuclease VapC